ncbi:transcription factor bHLH148-like [Canna indica]|uniref:Transcription factor bHLH148-like n=1 Tax=Canna indica TaxID=4628 RepID=A0AAQ3QA33_9LILI|nr:transcription factor bHLH148-like [Canna indica]
MASENAREEVAESAVTIKLRVENCSSSIDSVIAAFRCLKKMELKAAAVSIGFFGRLEVISTEREGKEEVEKATKTTFL